MKKRLLIINKIQFGQLTDSVKWCEYLKDTYDITFLCVDNGLPRYEMDGISFYYVPFVRFLHIGAILFLLACVVKILFYRGEILIEFFHGCGVLKRIFSRKKMFLDVRTLSIEKSEKSRNIFDKEISRCAKLYDRISVISEGVKHKLDLSKACILPLGSDVISTTTKQFDGDIRLLYVGTLLNRDIDKTILGLKLFIDANQDKKISYDIIGDGPNNELLELKKLVRILHLQQYVIFHGRIPYEKLNIFFNHCNVGVSFVPITDYYQYQPPTKTFEYAMSGLYCIATNTLANQEIINSKCGILINDTPEEFCKALFWIVNNSQQIKDTEIRQQLKRFNWKRIVDCMMIPMLEK